MNNKNPFWLFLSFCFGFAFVIFIFKILQLMRQRNSSKHAFAQIAGLPIKMTNKSIQMNYKIKKENIRDISSKRVQKVLSTVKKYKTIDIRKLKRHFPSVTIRTLRRDMDKLENDGKVKQLGKGRATTYVYIVK